MEANIVEIFYGIQGEGLLLGIPQLFVRFARCNLRCRYCDTEEARDVVDICKVEMMDEVKNPISISQLVKIIRGFTSPYHSINLTGGEPLLQADFISQFLKTLRAKMVYLETNGTLIDGLEKVVDLVDMISMDIKLPSTSGEGGLWDIHRGFLTLASRKQVFVKVVVESCVDLGELAITISIIKEIDPSIPLIIQPQTHNPPSHEELLRYYSIATSSLRDVRIIPQLHRLIGWR